MDDGQFIYGAVGFAVQEFDAVIGIAGVDQHDEPGFAGPDVFVAGEGLIGEDGVDGRLRECGVTQQEYKNQAEKASLFHRREGIGRTA